MKFILFIEPMSFILVLPFLAMTMCSCSSQAEIKQVTVSNKGMSYDYVFCDRRDSVLERLFVFRDGEVFSQVAEFPGYRNRTYFHTNKLPLELQRQATEWTHRKAELEPPLMPSGPWFSMLHVPRTAPELAKYRYFKNDNKDLQEFFKKMRECVITKENQVSSLPEWVTGNKEIKRWLGFFE